MAAPLNFPLAQNDIAPLNYFLHSYGPAATPTMYLGWVFAAVVLAVLVVIVWLLLRGVLRKRSDDNPRAIGAEHQGMAWIYVGTGISTLMLFGLAIYALITLNAVATPARAPALTLIVTAYDWWWKIDYEDADPARRFVTANEMHIPVGVPVLVKLKSADVIHAFWVPLLAGKTEMIPGLTNQQWLQADAPGIYRGQCGQYCGLQHAHMGMEVVAQSQDEFRQWRDAQLKTAAAAAGAEVKAGRELFIEQCAGCHTVRGTEAVGSHAPDLTHLRSRRLIAGGLLANTPNNQLRWINQVQELKPGARMPSFALSPNETAALSAFLATLN